MAALGEVLGKIFSSLIKGRSIFRETLFVDGLSTGFVGVGDALEGQLPEYHCWMANRKTLGRAHSVG